MSCIATSGNQNIESESSIQNSENKISIKKKKKGKDSENETFQLIKVQERELSCSFQLEVLRSYSATQCSSIFLVR